MSANLPYVITRTKTRGYIGRCLVEGCDVGGEPYTTPRIQHRTLAAERLRHHCRTVHDTFTEDLFPGVPPTGRPAMKEPKPESDLPDPERLSDYNGHLVVFTDATIPGKVKSKFGMSECDVLAYVYLPESKAWKNLGETPIFWKSVGFQISEAAPDSIGGVLTQGTGRNDREWNLVSASKAADKKLLAGFDKEHAEPF